MDLCGSLSQQKAQAHWKLAVKKDPAIDEKVDEMKQWLTAAHAEAVTIWRSTHEN